MCDINLLRPYYARPSVSEKSFSPVAAVATVDPPPLAPVEKSEEGLEDPDDEVLRGRLKNSESLANLDKMLKYFISTKEET